MGEEANTLNVPSQDPLALLKSLAEASAVFITLTFVAGWSYLSSYYTTFGLNPLNFDFAVPVVCTLALFVFYEAVWPLVVGGTLVIILAVISRRAHGLNRGWMVAAVGILLVAAASAGLLRGRQVADRDMLNDPSSTALPHVAFATKVQLKGGAIPSCVEWNSLGSADCKLLLHEKNAYYFFRPVASKGDDTLQVYVLADSDLIAVYEESGLDRNEKSQ